MTILVVGGTGTLGRQIVKYALAEGYRVKCLVRCFGRGAFLRGWGAELVAGDLSRPSTIPLNLKGIKIVIDAATIRVVTKKYRTEKIDWRGKLALLESAKMVKIKKFIYFSVFVALNSYRRITQRPILVPLLGLKLRIEKELEKSGLNYTIYQCSGFYQGLVGEYALPTLNNELIWLPSTSFFVRYLDAQDVAKVVIETLNNFKYNNTKTSLSGDRFWTPNEIVQTCERLSYKTAIIFYLPDILFRLLARFFSFFEASWNTGDRLQLGILVNRYMLEKKSQMELRLTKSFTPFRSWPFKRLTLEGFLQDYYRLVVKKVRETNYQKSKEVSYVEE
jgi:uncharacterized protein YbjT (DUF2867 family)